MAKIYYERDAKLQILKNKKIVILGYGSQGHAQSQNLRDSKLNVVVSTPKDGKGWSLAKSHGWIENKNLFPPTPDVIKNADWIQFLVPDEYHRNIWTNQVKPYIKKGVVLGFSHGFSIRYYQIIPPKECDVVLIAPKGPGHLVRRMFEEGKGVPALVAVQQDYSKKAKQLALAYCKAIGSTKAGVIETTFAEETETDNFGEQCILCGGLVELIKAGFETLVEAGYQPEIAYFECLHEMKLIVDLIYEGGIGWMNYSISDTAEYGEYTRGPKIITEKTKKEMKKILEEICSGKFAKEYLLENQVGRPSFNSYRQKLSQHLIEITGEKLRKMMSWLKKKE